MTHPPADDTNLGRYENPCNPMGGRRRFFQTDLESPTPDVMALSVQIQECESWDQLAELSVKGICSLIGAVDVRWTENAVDGKRTFWACSASEAHSEHLRKNLDQMIERSSELGVFYQEFVELMQGENEEILRLKTFLSPEAFRSNPYVRDFLAPKKVADVVSLQLFHSRGGSVIICCGMPEGERTSQQTENLKFIQKHVRIACQRLSRLASFTNLTDTLKELWQKGGSVGISVVAPGAEKLWETDTVSARILEELGGGKDEDGVLKMPPELSQWAKEILAENTRICAQTGEHTQTFTTGKNQSIKSSLLVERAGSGALLILKRDKASGDYGGIFTRRELDVIHSMTEGMTSQEASESLHISKRTVDKHLENIYVKLDVSNRISAIKRLEAL